LCIVSRFILGYRFDRGEEVRWETRDRSGCCVAWMEYGGPNGHARARSGVAEEDGLRHTRFAAANEA
jgi:hypothetical protein